MLLKDKSKRGAMAALILKKMSGSDEYDNLKSQNEEQMEAVPMEDGAELDVSEGTDTATHEMMEAMEGKNSSKFKSALMEFMKMAMREHMAKQKQD